MIIKNTDLEFGDIKYWCQFIGSVRSGHTLVSQIINAHKDALISDELGATRLFNKGVSRDKLFHAVNIRADSYFRGGNKTWTNRYSIGCSQNKTKRPKVIGDKLCGGDTTKFADKKYLERYIKHIGVPFKFIWVIREPQQHVNGKQSLAIGAKVKAYYTIESNIEVFKRQKAICLDIEKTHDVLRVYLDDLIADKENQIKRILDYLELDYDENHIKTCSDFIFEKPHTHNVEWSDEQLAMIQDDIDWYKNRTR